MATQYMITTNGVDYGTRYTTKGRAITEAETIGKVAEGRGHGDVITVQTVKTGKVVWTETYYTHTPEGMKFGPTHVEITGDADVPACITTADGPVTDDGVPFEVRHAAYVESLKSDPEVSRMLLAADEYEARQTGVTTGYVGIMQNVPGFNATEHIHAVGCRDITREMRKFGQSEADTFPYPSDMTVWDIIESNASDLSSDMYSVGSMEHAEDMIYQASGMLRFMPCAASLPLGVTPFGPLIDAEGQYVISEETSAPVTPELINVLWSYKDAEGRVWGPYSDGEFSHTHGSAETYCTGIVDTVGTGEVIRIDRYASDYATTGKNWEDTYTVTHVADAGFMESDSEPMADTMSLPITVDALLSVDVDGIKINLGWHTFTIQPGDERSIPTMYGQAHGEWKRPGGADWDSIIVVEHSETY